MLDKYTGVNYMYKFPDKPVLPELKYVPSSDESKTSGYLYSLNWEAKEQYVKIDNEIRIKNNWPTCLMQSHERFNRTMFFPVEYLDWLYNLKFLIPDDSFKEIAYQAKHGQEEWCRMFPEDYVIREPSIDHFRVRTSLIHFKMIFEILSFYLYNIEKKEKDKEFSFFAKVAMLIYFWDSQTGGGSILGELDKSSQIKGICGSGYYMEGDYNRLSEIYSPNNDKFNHSESTIKFVQNFQNLITERIEFNKQIFFGVPKEEFNIV
jgi:hypothetical protein